MAQTIRAISSMATRLLLADLARDYQAQSGLELRLESVGGVDAARRVQAGEAFDAVLLAADAIERLIASGHVRPDSRIDWVRSPVALAVRAGAPQPDVGSEAALRQAVQAARSLGVSTGPSGTALLSCSSAGACWRRCARASSRRHPGCPWAAWWPAARWSWVFSS